MKTINIAIISVLTFLLLVASASALYFWYKKPPVVSQTEYVTVEKIKVVTKIKEVPVPGPETIVTIDKPVLVQKIEGLPKWFKENPDEHGIASAVIEPYKGKTNTIATMNVKTGVGNIIAKQETLSLFGFVNEKEVGVRAGYGTKEFEGAIYGQWDFVRIGGMYVGLYGEGNVGSGNNSKADAKAQVKFGYKF